MQKYFSLYTLSFGVLRDLATLGLLFCTNILKEYHIRVSRNIHANKQEIMEIIREKKEPEKIGRKPVRGEVLF